MATKGHDARPHERNLPPSAARFLGAQFAKAVGPDAEGPRRCASQSTGRRNPCGQAKVASVGRRDPRSRAKVAGLERGSQSSATASERPRLREPRHEHLRATGGGACEREIDPHRRHDLPELPSKETRLQRAGSRRLRTAVDGRQAQERALGDVGTCRLPMTGRGRRHRERTSCAPHDRARPKGYTPPVRTTISQPQEM